LAFSHSLGRTLPSFIGTDRPIAACRHQPKSPDSVEKVGHPKLTAHWMVKMPFLCAATEIRVRKPLPKVKISISDAYFSDAQTMADFFNRIGQLLPIATGNNRPTADCRFRQRNMHVHRI
jgi:hypothetical protein